MKSTNLNQMLFQALSFAKAHNQGNQTYYEDLLTGLVKNKVFPAQSNETIEAALYNCQWLNDKTKNTHPFIYRFRTFDLGGLQTVMSLNQLTTKDPLNIRYVEGSWELYGVTLKPKRVDFLTIELTMLHNGPWISSLAPGEIISGYRINARNIDASTLLSVLERDEARRLGFQAVSCA